MSSESSQYQTLVNHFSSSRSALSRPNGLGRAMRRLGAIGIIGLGTLFLVSRLSAQELAAIHPEPRLIHPQLSCGSMVRPSHRRRSSASARNYPEMRRCVSR